MSDFDELYYFSSFAAMFFLCSSSASALMRVIKASLGLLIFRLSG
jgi:hypothetical protein